MAKKNPKLFDTTPKPTRVALVGITLPTQRKGEMNAHLKELQALATTAGVEVVKVFTQQLDNPHPNTLIGKGKIVEIALFIKEHEINRIIFDDELSPAQNHNLEKGCSCEVWDRSMLILKIFAQHARTSHAKTQVELANYLYLLPRLTGMWTHHSRQRGGVGLRGGPGEKELETDKRMAQHKIKLLKEKLVKLEKVAETQRKNRKNPFKVTLVGYTNAGKSTAMRTLSKEQVLVADKLFATLSPTVRKVVIHDQTVLLTDTVGFIRKLPHSLIASFKSTLAEVKEADLLLHIVDASHPDCEEHINVVHKVLEEIAAAHIPILLVLNKEDRVIADLKEKDPGIDPAAFLKGEKERISKAYGLPALYCSALKKNDIEGLKEHIHAKMTQAKKKSHT